MGHTSYLFASPDDTVQYVRAHQDTLNPGVLMADGTPTPTPFHMYVDDNMYADIRERMLRAIAASIDSLFIIQGQPHPDRRLALSLKKLEEAPASYSRIILGFLVDTRQMRVFLPPPKRAEALALLSTFCPPRRSVTLREVARLVGTLTHLCSICHWARYHFSALTHSIKVALRLNQAHLRLQPHFSKWIQIIASKVNADPSLPNNMATFFQTKCARALWNCPLKIFITKDMRLDINTLHEALSNPSRFPWHSPISHLIPRTPNDAYGDACLTAGGGYSFDFSFWWFVKWPDHIHRRTIKFLSTGGSDLVSINLLEFIVIIINHVAAGHALQLGFHSDNPPDPYPTLRNFVDNRSALQWSTRAAKSSQYAQALGRILSNQLLGSRLALSSEFIPGIENSLADDISRSPHLSADSPSFSSLTQKYPKLASCRQFHPSPELLSTLYLALSDASAPNLGTKMQPGHFDPAKSTGSPSPTITA